MTETLPPVRATQIFSAAGGPWCYDVWGFNGRPVVLIPSMLFDRVSWWPAAADLRPYATIVAVDLPGHGTSAPRPRYEPDELVDDLAQLIDSLQIRRAPILVGHGTSAVLATLFAARYATHAVVAVDPSAPADLRSGVDGYLETMNIDEIPERYRGMIQAARNPQLYAAHATGLRGLRPATATIGVTPARLAVHSQPTELPETDPAAAQQWSREIYDVPGRFAHVVAVERFVNNIRALL